MRMEGPPMHEAHSVERSWMRQVLRVIRNLCGAAAFTVASLLGADADIPEGPTASLPQRIATGFVDGNRAIASNPAENDELKNTVDMIVIHHYYDDVGHHMSDQIIFYDWSPGDARYQVRAFRILKGRMQLPQKDFRTGRYVALWHDGQSGDALRRISALSVEELWVQYDPELMERKHLPEEKRRGLRRPDWRSTLNSKIPPPSNAYQPTPLQP